LRLVVPFFSRAASLVRTHGVRGLLFGNSSAGVFAAGSSGTGGELRRRGGRASSSSAMSSTTTSVAMSLIGGSLTLRLTAVRLLLGALRRFAARWRKAARRRTNAHKLG
jgi:hypothetical protein